MRLINTTTLELHEFPDAGQCPPYAILSHVWRPGSESTLQDLIQFQADCRAAGEAPHTDRWSMLKHPTLSEKIVRCCEYARADGHAFLWIDTCCIDKTSSAELSEAINSMSRYYARADVCYAYLHDVDTRENPRTAGSRFRRSRWFTRGWTLQELIFPRAVVFLSCEWEMLGDKRSLCREIEETAGIAAPVLTGELGVQSVSVAARMSWAARRQTTRVEDEAYCLLGIFGVHMPTIYGEGGNAFLRLQEEILKKTSDQSLFAWGPSAVLHPANLKPIHAPEGDSTNTRPILNLDESDVRTPASLLAPSPSHFARYAGITPCRRPPKHYHNHFLGHKTDLTREYAITPQGFRARFVLLPLSRVFPGSSCCLALLGCEDSDHRLMGLVLSELDVREMGADVPALVSRRSSKLVLDSEVEPSMVRIIYLDPSLLSAFERWWSPARPKEITIQLVAPLSPSSRSRSPSTGGCAGLDAYRHDESPRFVGECTITFAPWLERHASDWGYTLDQLRRTRDSYYHDPRAESSGLADAVMRSHGDTYVLRFVAHDGRPDVTVYLCLGYGHQDAGFPPEPRGVLRVSTFVDRPSSATLAGALPDLGGPHRQVKAYGAIPSFVDWRRYLDIIHDKDPRSEVWAWPHAAKTYHLDAAQPRLSMSISFWDSRGAWISADESGQGGFTVEGRRYTMDVTFHRATC
ncbi:heterokaryon incompatibility protein-domain-containing protein [Trametes polyzona]|nr:heterokaryon incompatibility protein-domain-containing protein [Trametes polyzona]